MFIYGISIIGVVLSGIASMLIGFIWYSNILFADAWMKENRFKNDDLNPNPILFVSSFILAIISAASINTIINLSGYNSLIMGAFIGFAIGIGIVATTFGTSYLFEKKSIKLFLINAGYQVVYFTISGFIVSLFI